jgi:hypothetical protein
MGLSCLRGRYATHTTHSPECSTDRKQRALAALITAGVALRVYAAVCLNQVVYRAGDVADCFYIIAQGTVTLFDSKDKDTDEGDTH